MICIRIYDLGKDEIVRFWWTATNRRAETMRRRYAAALFAAGLSERYEVCIAGSGGSYNLDNACGY